MRLPIVIAGMGLSLLMSLSGLAQTTNELGTTDEEPGLSGASAQGLPVIPVTAQYRDPVANNVAAAVNSAHRRVLETNVHTPWQIMHATLGMRQNFRIKHDGKLVSGLEWLSSGPKFEGEDWFQVTKWGGRAHPYSRPYAFEGHANQSLAILSMLGLPLEHKIKAGKKTITVGDMVNHAKMEINDKEEVAWSLWSLSRYLPANATWQNKDGEVWNLDRLVQLQLKKKLKGSPCGGTHAMFALAHARNIRLQSGLPLRGVWLEAEQRIQKCIELARVQQNANGMFSSKFFEGRANDDDFDKRIASSGHVLEFLMIALPPQRMNDSWVRRGVDATARDIIANRREYVKCSPLYHAINGLTIYLDRTQPGVRRPQVAARPASSTRVIEAETHSSDETPKLSAASVMPILIPTPLQLVEINPTKQTEDDEKKEKLPAPELMKSGAMKTPQLPPADQGKPENVKEPGSTTEMLDDETSEMDVPEFDVTPDEKKAESDAKKQ